MKVLVLDDDALLREAIGRMLEAERHEAEGTDDAKAAIRMVEDGDYDFVLVDFRMPVADGLWFMRNVKLPKKTKALLMTAFVNRAVIDEMFRLGAVGYLIKPFDGDELLHHLNFHHRGRPSGPPPVSQALRF